MKMARQYRPAVLAMVCTMLIVTLAFLGGCSSAVVSLEATPAPDPDPQPTPSVQPTLQATLDPSALEAKQEWRERYRIVGVARASVKIDEPIITVGQQTITLADMAEGKAQMEANLDYMRGQITNSRIDTAYLEAFVGMVTESGVDNVALAELILSAALQQRAIDEGFGATEEELRSEINRQQEIEAAADTIEFEGYIQAVGEERYWSEIMPARLEREIAIRNMRVQVLTQAAMQAADSEPQLNAWNELERDTVHNTALTVLKPEALAPATIDGAIDYLEDYWALSP